MGKRCFLAGDLQRCVALTDHQFRRAWIVQEAVLAAKLVMWCGPLQFNFDVLAMSSLFLWQSHWWAHIANDVASRQKTRFGPGISRMLPASLLTKYAAELSLLDGPPDLYESDADMKHGFDPVYALCQIWDKKIVLRKGKPVGTYFTTVAGELQPTRYEEMFTSFRLLEATEPKDKVYAFLGLRPVDSGAAPLVPDYRKEKACNAVYTEAAIHVLKTAQTLDLLAYREDDSRGRDTSLPSWVPDLGKPAPNNPIQGASLTPWSAAGDVPIHLTFHEPHDHVLQLDGLYVDDVSNSAAWKGGDISHREELLPELGGLYAIHNQHKADDTAVSDAVASESSDPATSPIPQLEQVDNGEDNLDNMLLQTRIEVLWRTLIADCCQEQHPAPQKYGIAFADSLRHEIQTLESAVLYDVRPTNTTSSPDEPSKSQLLNAALASYNHLAQYELNDLAALDQVAELYGMRQEGRDLDEASPQEGKLRGFSPREPLLRPFSGILFGPSEADAAGTKLADDPWKTDAQRKQALNEFQLRSTQMLDHRVLFTTRDERFLGLGPQSLRQGDQVWLLAGAKVPHVLRPKENGKFELVG